MGHFKRRKKTGMDIYDLDGGKTFQYEGRNTNHFLKSLTSLIVNIVFDGRYWAEQNHRLKSEDDAFSKNFPW